jgi:hypothetical protein
METYVELQLGFSLSPSFEYLDIVITFPFVGLCYNSKVEMKPAVEMPQQSFKDALKVG